MGSEWVREKIGNLANSISQTHPLGKEQLIFLNTSDILHGNILQRTYSSTKDWPGQAKKSIRKGDILFSEIRPANGRYSFIGFEADDYVVSTKLMVIRAGGSILPKYLYHFLTSKETINWLQFLAESRSGTFPQITFEQIAELEIYLPPKIIQEAIVVFIDTLDEKIELNRRMSQTLEEMARALFKAWFVDFEPVRAKMEGRWKRGKSLPGLPGTGGFGTGEFETRPYPYADLFPDLLVDSELGEIPEGWEIRKLSDLCSTQYGYTASAVDEQIGPKFLRVTDINKQNWIEWDNVPHCEIDSDAKQAYALEIGDLVVARMADPGKSAIIEDDIDAVFASYLVRLKTRSLAHSYYVYGFLKSELYAEYAEGARSGSVQANMNARVIVGASLVVPPTKVMEQFLRAVLPLRQRLASNVHESHTLATLRDTLLPKLISSELRVKDAERFLKERGL